MIELFVRRIFPAIFIIALVAILANEVGLPLTQIVPLVIMAAAAVIMLSGKNYD